MNISVLGIDLAKNKIHVHGIDVNGAVQFKKSFNRSQLTVFVAKLRSCVIGMEACGSSSYWARKFQAFGHTVKLMSPQFVKPYVKGNKNDANDAEAICEAVTRPSMRFVPIKSVEQQDTQSLHRIRAQIIKSRTALSNQIRGLLGEYGITIPQQRQNVRKLLPEILEDAENGLTANFREMLSELYDTLALMDERINQYDKKIEIIYKQDEKCKKIGQIEGVGPITATAIVSALSNPKLFKSGREFSAWLGLVPRQHSTGGKQTLLGISKRGDTYLRTLLVHGARAVAARSKSKPGKRNEWLKGLIERRGFNKAVVAFANKNARIIWAVLSSGEEYRATA